MSIIIFLIILTALIFVHEMGHFLAARKFGIKVDEFGFGFPPKAKTLFVWKETPFTLNWLPFGGFVKIFGENPDSESSNVSSDSFQSKNRGIQAAVLAAGVFFNFLFAWVLISIGFMTGLPSPAGMGVPIKDPKTVITIILPASPAGFAGLRSGDAILSLTRGNERLPEQEKELSPASASDFISKSLEPIAFEIDRGGVISEVIVSPREGLIADRPAVGISMDIIGIAQLAPHRALWHGLKTTWELTTLTAVTMGDFILDAFRGKADLAGVTGPVGIVGMVGDVRQLGFSYLLTFTALISINLAVINLLPIPALDGGRLVFVALEALTRRKIPAKIFNTINSVGFALLILLMLVITFRDVKNLF